MHQILLSKYFREELQQRIQGRCLSGEGPIGSCSVTRPHQPAKHGEELEVAFMDRAYHLGVLVLRLRHQRRLHKGITSNCQVGKAGKRHSRQDTVSPKAPWYEARVLVQVSAQSPAWLKPRGE